MADDKEIQRLIRDLGSRDWEVRNKALRALERIGADNIPVKDKVRALLLLDENDVVKMGEPTIPYLIDALKDENSDVQRNAAKALGKIGDERAVPALIVALKDEDRYMRESAAKALGKIGNGAVPALIDALKDDGDWVRIGAADALANIAEVGIDCSAAIPALVIALKNENSDVRKRAASALDRIGLDKIPIKDKVFALLLTGGTWRIGIAKEGIDVSAAVPTLIDALKDEDRRVRKNAASTLGNIGDARAVPALINALKDTDWNVRYWAAWALSEIAEKGDHASALKIIKDSTTAIMEFYSGKKDRYSLRKRRDELRLFDDTAEKIHDKMNPDKKKFPVKHQPVRTVRKKVIRNG